MRLPVRSRNNMLSSNGFRRNKRNEKLPPKRFAFEPLEIRYMLSASPPSYLQSLVASKLTSQAPAATSGLSTVTGSAGARLSPAQLLDAALSNVGTSTAFNLSGGEFDASFDTSGRLSLAALPSGADQNEGIQAPGLPSLGRNNVASLPLTASALVFQGQDNVNDTLSLDLTNLPRDAAGSFALNTVVYNGGVGGWDTLIVTGGSFQAEIYHPTGKDSGIITYQLPDSAGPLMPGQNTTRQSFTIIFTGLEPVETYGSATYIGIDDYNAGDQIYAVDGTPHNGQDTIKVYEASGNFENITFANKHGVYIETWDGDSTIDFSGVSTSNTALAATVTNGLVLWGAGDNNILKANAATNLNQSLNGSGNNNTFYAAGGGTLATHVYGYGGSATYIMPTTGNIYIGGDSAVDNTIDFSALSNNVTINLGSTSSQTAATGLTMMLATNTTVTTILGFTETDRLGRLYNSAAVFHKGLVIGVYRKLHPAINRSIYEAGDKAPVFVVGDLTFGIIICRDSTFVEPARIMASQGATVLFVPSNNGLPPGKAGPEIVAEARSGDIMRATENCVSVVRADVVGRTADLASYGTSGIVDPDGVVLATPSPGMTGLIVADIEVTPRKRRRGGS